jgi:hypothetical protein
MGGRWEIQQTLDSHPTSMTPPPAECHDVAKKKKILEETPETEVSQYTIVVTYSYLRKLQMTQSNLFNKGQTIYYKL